MESIYDVIEKIRNGPPELRQNFIENNKDFISRVIGSAFDKSAIIKNSDEFNLGVSAFDYSIDNFNAETDGDFFEYAEKNIKKWVRDALIKNAQGISQNTSYYESCYDKNCELNEEISAFKNELWKHGITMKDLIHSTPKSSYLIVRAIKLAKDLSNSSEFAQKLATSKKIDLGYIGIDNIDKKILRQNYKYIIALCLIMKSKLEILKGYIKNVELNWNLSEFAGVVLVIKGSKATIMTEDCKFLSIKKPFNVDVGNEINYKHYYIPDSQFTNIKKIIISGCAAAAALFVIAGLIMLIQSTGNKKQELASSKVGSISDTSMDLDEEDNDMDKDVELSQNDSSSSTESETSKTSAIADNGKNNNSKGKNAASTPKSTKNATPLAAANNPGNTKKPENVKDTPTEEKRPAANKPAPTESVPTKSATLPSQLKTASPSSKSEPENITVIRATGKPGNVIIRSDKNNVKVGEDFTITSIMTGGNNGTQWFLLENNEIISTMRRTDHSPDSQTISRIITAEKPGTYIYKCIFENSFGRTESTTIQVTVSD